MKLPLDPLALDQAITNVGKARMMSTIREWIIMTAPPEVHEVWVEYEKIIQENEIKIDE